MKSFHLEYIFRKVRKSDWGEICVAIDARSSVVFFALILLPRTAELDCDTENRIESNSPIYLFIFFFQRTDEKFRKNIYYVRSNLARIITFSSFMFIPRSLHPPSSRKISSTPRSVDEHGVSIDAFAIRIEAPSPGRYLMKRQSHLRIAISNSARQRRTRGRVGGRRQRSRSAVTR